MLDARSPEPLVLRWAHLDTMRITIASGYDNDYVSACELRDQAGNTVTVSHRLGDAIKAVADEAERVLAPRLGPRPHRAVQRGRADHRRAHHGRLGRALAPRAIPGGPGRSPGGDARRIEFELQGQRAAVKTGRHVRGERSLSVDGEPNSFVIGYLSPEPPRRKRHPARTAFAVAVVIGILVSLALAGVHSGMILTPGNDSGDHIASLWHVS